jgi:uncharacterized membrane protein (DUF4010 family)
MYGRMTGWAWLWMTIMPLAWIAILGFVIYIAVRLGDHDSAKPRGR